MCIPLYNKHNIDSIAFPPFDQNHLQKYQLTHR